MKSIPIYIYILTIIFSLSACDKKVENYEYVDPKIGNIAPLLVPTYPTIHLPNEMLRVFPVRKDYNSDEISFFPLQVISYRAAGVFRVQVSSDDSIFEQNSNMQFDHDLEKIYPWYYYTYLVDHEIDVALTSGEKCAIYKFNFPESEENKIHISGSGKFNIYKFGSKGFAAEETFVYNRRNDPDKLPIKIYCYLELENSAGNTLINTNLVEDNKEIFFSVDEKSTKEVFLKYAVSYISSEQAKINFDTELSEKNFDNLRMQGRSIWQKTLGKIEVKGGSEADRRRFFTALYRCYERMININEGGKYFSSYDNQVHESDRPFYTDDWVWDTYRAHHPLRIILDPDKESDMLDSYVQMYLQSGRLPTFPQVYGNRMCMNSYHSGILFIDALRKGISGFDSVSAYQGINKNLIECTWLPWRQGLPTCSLDSFFYESGYFPALHPGEKETVKLVDDFEKRQSVAVTLGACYDYWGLAELAKELGFEHEAKNFREFSNNYRKLWDSSALLFMPKDESGEWINIDPKNGGRMGFREYYDENNAWTYAWDLAFDIDGLIDLHGSKENAANQLDALFRESLDLPKYLFYINGANSTGMIGQFSIGNEPSFHIPYLYNHFGKPWKTQRLTRFILDVWFKDTYFGIPGDEDGGGMSAFVVFSSMGLYPTTPGLPVYDITTPVFEEMKIHLNNGQTFIVEAENLNSQNLYIQESFLNNKKINRHYLTHSEIINGGKLRLVMGDSPNKLWGQDDVIN